MSSQVWSDVVCSIGKGLGLVLAWDPASERRAVTPPGCSERNGEFNSDVGVVCAHCSGPSGLHAAPVSVVQMLALDFKMIILRISSWGLTLPILESPPALGGNNLPQPRTFLLWQHATPFLLSCTEPLSVPAVARAHFRQWAVQFGVPLDPIQLPRHRFWMWAFPCQTTARDMEVPMCGC